MIGQLTDAEIESYLEDRAAKGINMILVSAPEAYYADNAPNNIDDVAPFTGAPFQSALNDRYWRRVDFAVDRAAELGITLMICPFYFGYADDADGWSTQIKQSTDAQIDAYAGELAERYGTDDNIVWLIGHDVTPDDTLKDRGKAFADRIQADTSQLVTVGGNHPLDAGGPALLGIGSDEWSSSGVALDFDTQYDYSGQIAVNSYRMWDLTPTLPFLFFEGAYEQEVPGPVPVGDVLLREQMWAAWCAGAAGVLFGNNPIWHFESGGLGTSYAGTWRENLDYKGSTDLAAFASITATIGPGWASTAADTAEIFVTNQGSGTDRVAARFSPTLGLIYHPNFDTATLRVDLAQLSAGGRAATITRYDVRSGESTLIGEFPTTGTYDIAPPPTNSAGDRDWLFVVEATP